MEENRKVKAKAKAKVEGQIKASRKFTVEAEIKARGCRLEANGINYFNDSVLQ